MGNTIRRIALGVAAVVVAAIGIALTVVTGGAFAVVLGSGLFTAGLFGLMQVVFDPNVSVASFFKSMAKGFAIGVASGLCSFYAAGTVASIAAATGVNSVLVAAGLSSVTGLLTNGFSNMLHGKNFFDGWKKAMVFGAIIGSACQSLTLGTQSQEAVAGINQVRDAIVDLIPGASRLARYSDQIRNLLPNIKISVKSMKEIWVWATDLLALQRPEAIPQIQNVPELVPVSVSVPGGQLGTMGGNNQSSSPNSSSNKKENEAIPGIEEVVAVLEELTQENKERLQEILKKELLSEEYEERNEVLEIRENHEAVLEDLVEPQIEPAVKSSEEQAVEREIEVIRDVEENLIDTLNNAEPQRETGPYLKENVISSTDFQNEMESQTNPLHQADVLMEKKEIPNEVHVLNTLERETITKINVQGGILPELRQKVKAQLQRKFLKENESKLKRRAFDSFSPKSQIRAQFELFSCYKEQEKMAEEAKEVVKEKQREKVFVNATEGGQRLGIPSGSDAAPQTSSAGIGGNQKKTEKLGGKSSKKPLSSLAYELIQNGKIQLPKDEKKAVVFKIASHSEEKNEYFLNEQWPEFDYNVRVVGVLGNPGSGKTYGILRILVALGYGITQEDVALARLRMGINGYLLQKDKILIAECCDGMNFGMELEEERNFNMGGTLLELLSYSTASRILYSFPFHYGKPKESAEEIVAKLELLARMADQYTTVAKRDVRVLLRTSMKSPENVDQMAKEMDVLLRGRSEEPMETTLSEDFKKRLEFIRGTGEIKSQILKNHETTEVSMKYKEDNNKELLSVVNFVAAGKSSVEMNSNELREFVFNLFERMKEKDLPKKLVEVQNMEIENQNRSGTSEAVKDFLNTVSDYINVMHSSDTMYKGFAERLIEYFKDFERRVKEAENLPEDERSGKMTQMILQHILDISDRLIGFASSHPEKSVLCERGIRLGLNGYLIFPLSNSENASLNQISLRMALDTGLMGHLMKPIVYNNYGSAWNLFTLLARYGFRLRLFEFDFWSAMKPFFRIDKEANDLSRSELLVYSGILRFLRETTDGTAHYFKEKRSFRGERNSFVGNENIAQIGFDFQKEMTEEMDFVCERLSQNPSKFLEEHQKFSERPKSWIESSSYSKKFKDSRDESKKEVLEALTHRNMEIMHKSFAKEMVRKAMDFLSELCTCKYEEQKEGISIMKSRLATIGNFAKASSDDKTMYLRLMRSSPVLPFLIGFIIREESFPYFPQFLNSCAQLIVAEDQIPDLEPADLIPKQSELSNMETMIELRERLLIQEIVKDLTFVRYELLKAGMTKRLLREFCQGEMAFTDIDEFIIALNNFLISHYDLEKLSSDQYMAKRMEITSKILGHMLDCAEILHRREGENTLRSMTEIGRCALLLNTMISKFHAKDGKYEGEFFETTRDDDLSRHNWRQLEEVTRQLFRLRHFEKASINSLRNMQNVLFLMLNMASLSRKSVPDVLRKRGENRPHGIGSLPDSDTKAFSDKINEIDVEIPFEKDDRFATVAADILAGEDLVFSQTHDELKKRILDLQKTENEFKENEKMRKEWEEEQRERRKRNAIQTVSVDRELLAKRFENVENSPKLHLAVEDVFFHSSHLRISVDSYRNPRFALNILLEKFSKGPALAHFLLFYNCGERLKEEFCELKWMVDKILEDQKMISILNPERPKVQKMLEIRHFDIFLTELGYRKREKKFEIESNNGHSEILEHLKIFQRVLQNGNGAHKASLDSSFSLVPIENRDTGKVILPKAFFRDLQEGALRRCAETCSVDQLREMRNGRLPRQLAFTLVRAWKADACFQAVFHPKALVSAVVESLVNSSIIFKDITLKQKGPVDLSKTLSEIGFYFIEFHLE